ncbi:hypothetical protein BC826DRAFT_1105856 [Russula brevipes]|nr:hypothetical protein BC826DRAFT_1105856 [Russula brevipes]
MGPHRCAATDRRQLLADLQAPSMTLFLKWIPPPKLSLILLVSRTFQTCRGTLPGGSPVRWPQPAELAPWKLGKITAAGKALDKIIKNSRKRVPDELLDEQDRLEDQGISEMEN